MRLLRDSRGRPRIKTRSVGDFTKSILFVSWPSKLQDHFERALDIYKRCLHANLKKVEVYPGMRDLLEKLRKADRPIALVTSIPDRSFVNAVLERVQIKHRFKTVVTGEDVKRPKPDPEGVQLALQGLSFSQSQVLMVSDSSTDIQAGEEGRGGNERCSLGFEGLEGFVKPPRVPSRARFRISNSGGIEPLPVRGLI